MADQKSEWETPGAATMWTGSDCLLGSVIQWVSGGDSVDILQQKPFFFEVQLGAMNGVNLFNAADTVRTATAIEA